MTAYVVNHPYTATRDGRRFGPWDTGTTVDLDEADAAWVLRDSPGVIARVGESAEPAKDDAATEKESDPKGEEPTEKESDSEDEKPTEDDAAAEKSVEPERAKTPARNRQHRGGRNRSS
ncbi:hypothetical protein [Nocardiopsis synnemataformans]|uniref:hypothetical protein n=1 Tax=Nocardiopsis synnemataformans TaxID=61305 RepID=UPI003EBAFFFC